MNKSALLLLLLLPFSSLSFSERLMTDEKYYGTILKSNVFQCSSTFAAMESLLELKTKNHLSFNQFRELYHSTYNTEFGTKDTFLKKVYKTENPIYAVRECPSNLIERITTIGKQNDYSDVNKKHTQEFIQAFEDMDKICSNSSDDSLEILTCYHRFADKKIKERAKSYYR